MALSVFLHGSRKLPVLNNVASKLLCAQFKNSTLGVTPIIAKKFSGINYPILDQKKIGGAHNLQMIQARHISHSAIWTAEKILSIALVAIIPACVAFPSLITDNILAVAVVLHMHWGVEAVIVDYIRPSLVGKIIPPIARTAVYLMSILTLGGLIYFNYNDIGCTKAVRRVWSIKGKQDEEEEED